MKPDPAPWSWAMRFPERRNRIVGDDSGSVRRGKARRMTTGTDAHEGAVTLHLSHPIDDEIELRLLGPWDAPQLYAVIDANREHLGQWCGWVDRHQDVTEARREVAQGGAPGDGSDQGSSEAG